MTETYCCPMRRYFLIGLVGTRKGESAPVDVADFVVDWESPTPTLAIKFCPFCGEPVAPDQTLRKSQ